MITPNPLNNIVCTKIKNPDWCCKHISAKIIDYKNKVYSCDICTKGLSTKKFNQEELHINLNKEKK
jgi:hypothetical protein